MRQPLRPFVGLALALAVSAGLSACASRAKPVPTDPLGGQPDASQVGPTGPAGPAGPGGVTGGPLGPGGAAATGPGSLQDFVISAGDRVYFEFDRYDLRADALPVLQAQARWLARYPRVQVIIEGNADERGTREYNLALGARRANSVRDFLVAQGVAPGRIQTVSYGKERPIADGSNEEAWAKNRNARTNFQGNDD